MRDKTIFITGGNSGIGLATACLFAAEGARIAILGRREEKNAAAQARIEAAGGQCLAFTGDASDANVLSQALKGTVETFGSLNYAFNNAGVEQLPAPLQDISEADYYRITDINFKGIWLAMQQQIPLILEAGGGAIVNTSSIGGHIGMPHFPLYVATKHAILGLTKSMALAYADQPLRINAICPGYTDDTGIYDTINSSSPEVVQAVKQTIPMGRFGKPEEMAKAVLYLCRDATWTTGQSLIMDGGSTAA